MIEKIPDAILFENYLSLKPRKLPFYIKKRIFILFYDGGVVH